jgi:hypothetical protein
LFADGFGAADVGFDGGHAGGRGRGWFAQEAVHDPGAAEDGRGAGAVGGDLEQGALREQAATDAAGGEGDAADGGAFDAGQFVEAWDDENARKGYCLYKMGCRGPTTYNACSTVRWNGGVSFPIQSGHGCIGCSEKDFWDNGPFYNRLQNINQFAVEGTADAIGAKVALGVGAAITAHAGLSAIKRVSMKKGSSPGAGGSEGGAP